MEDDDEPTTTREGGDTPRVAAASAGADEEEMDETPLNLHVTHLAGCDNEDTLEELFHEFGPILSIIVLRNADPRVPTGRGVGFVKFQRRSDGLRAMKALDHFKPSISPPSRRPIRVSIASGKSPPCEQPTRVIVRNVPFEVSLDQMYQLASTYGTVHHIARWPRRPDGVVIDFTKKESAQPAANFFNDVYVAGARLSAAVDCQWMPYDAHARAAPAAVAAAGLGMEQTLDARHNRAPPRVHVEAAPPQHGGILVLPQQAQAPMPPGAMSHIAGPAWSGLMSVSQAGSWQQSAGLPFSSSPPTAHDFQRSYYGHGAHPAGFYTHSPPPAAPAAHHVHHHHHHPTLHHVSSHPSPSSHLLPSPFLGASGGIGVGGGLHQPHLLQHPHQQHHHHAPQQHHHDQLQQHPYGTSAPHEYSSGVFLPGTPFPHSFAPTSIHSALPPATTAAYISAAPTSQPGGVLLFSYPPPGWGGGHQAHPATSHGGGTDAARDSMGSPAVPLPPQQHAAYLSSAGAPVFVQYPQVFPSSLHPQLHQE